MKISEIRNNTRKLRIIFPLEKAIVLGVMRTETQLRELLAEVYDELGLADKKHRIAIDIPTKSEIEKEVADCGFDTVEEWFNSLEPASTH